MITFVDTLVRILNDDDFIKDVDCSHMWLTDTAMTVLPYHLSPHLYLKLMRLQTIKIHQYDLMDSLVPSHVRRIAAEIHTDQVTVTIQSTEINSDCARRINMLDWLIVEEVRRAIPSECERLNVKYAIDAQRALRYKSLQT